MAAIAISSLYDVLDRGRAGPASYPHDSHRVLIPCRSGRHWTRSEPAAPRREHHGPDAMLLTDLSAKELEILKDAVPQAERIGVLWNPTTPSHAPALKAIEAGAEKLGVKLRIVPARTRDDFPAAFAAMVDERVDALLVVSSPLARVERICNVAATRRDTRLRLQPNGR
jgi:hypothetical protein